MRRLSVLTFALCLLAAAPVSAHDTLPTKWCPSGTQPVVTGQFAFTEAQLIAYRNERLADGAVLGSQCKGVKTCGIIDEWYWANQMAHEYAMSGMHKQSASMALSESRMPIVKTPTTFNLNTDRNRNGILDHHDQYRFYQGLSGDYVVCRAIASPQPPSTQVRAR